VTLVALIGFIIYRAGTVPVVKIVVNEKTFGYSASIDEAEHVVESAVHTLGEEVNESVNTKTDDKITYVSLRVDKKTFEEHQAKPDDIAQYVTTYIPGYGISVNNRVDIVLSSYEEARAVLEGLQAHYAAPSEDNDVKAVYYEETVELVETKAQPLDIKSPEQAMQALLEGKPRPVDHVVAAGETLQDVARQYNTSVEAIVAENKALTAESPLTAGISIKLVDVQPYLNVVVEGLYSATEDIAYETETVKDAKVAQRIQVQQEGQPGAKEITYTYVKRNGALTRKDVISEKITKEPTKEIILEGTQASFRLAGGGSANIARGSGAVPQIRWPLDTGSVTSPFSSQNPSRPNHTGTDVGVAVGTPCYAAASGKVVAASWDGGYGNQIVVDHGNGVGTRYAHLSAMHVAVGHQVSRGQKIAATGNTGNSTGPHLHFEIIVNTDGTLRYLDPEVYR
jgi:murein DD-endopeptidase MepM/ murein hydrolase activator NlpD